MINANAALATSAFGKHGDVGNLGAVYDLARDKACRGIPNAHRVRRAGHDLGSASSDTYVKDPPADVGQPRLQAAGAGGPNVHAAEACGDQLCATWRRLEEVHGVLCLEELVQRTTIGDAPNHSRPPLPGQHARHQPRVSTAALAGRQHHTSAFQTEEEQGQHGKPWAKPERNIQHTHKCALALPPNRCSIKGTNRKQSKPNRGSKNSGMHRASNNVANFIETQDASARQPQVVRTQLFTDSGKLSWERSPAAVLNKHVRHTPRRRPPKSFACVISSHGRSATSSTSACIAEPPCRDASLYQPCPEGHMAKPATTPTTTSLYTPTVRRSTDVAPGQRGARVFWTRQYGRLTRAFLHRNGAITSTAQHTTDLAAGARRQKQNRTFLPPLMM